MKSTINAIEVLWFHAKTNVSPVAIKVIIHNSKPAAYFDNAVAKTVSQIETNTVAVPESISLSF